MDCWDIAAGQLSSYTSPEVDSEDHEQNLPTGSTDAEPLAVLAHLNPATGLKVHATMSSLLTTACAVWDGALYSV